MMRIYLKEDGLRTIPQSLWIQPYLLRKWDWGMIWGVSRTFEKEVFGFIGNMNNINIYILLFQLLTIINHRLTID